MIFIGMSKLALSRGSTVRTTQVHFGDRLIVNDGQQLLHIADALSRWRPSRYRLLMHRVHIWILLDLGGDRDRQMYPYL